MEVFNSCGVIFQNNLMIFGGESNSNQGSRWYSIILILLNWMQSVQLLSEPWKVLRVRSDLHKVDSYDHYRFMERLAPLNFEFDEGACNTFEDSQGKSVVYIFILFYSFNSCAFFCQLTGKRGLKRP